jgi:hypothetical protein
VGLFAAGRSQIILDPLRKHFLELLQFRLRIDSHVIAKAALAHVSEGGQCIGVKTILPGWPIERHKIACLFEQPPVLGNEKLNCRGSSLGLPDMDNGFQRG